MNGTVAITDPRWYEALKASEHDEVNFWKPSARQTFHADEFSPFFFKLPKPHYAICGFGFFAQYSRLPIWLAWDVFGQANGCANLVSSRRGSPSIALVFDMSRATGTARSAASRSSMRSSSPNTSGWPNPPTGPSTVSGQKYDLDQGEGERVWSECLLVAQGFHPPRVLGRMTDETDRYGEPIEIRPSRGRGRSRSRSRRRMIARARSRARHSLPALEAAHILPYALGGPHALSNGLLLRADLHRLFERGYLTVTPDLSVKVSARLREEYRNGHTYYPLDGASARGRTSRARNRIRASSSGTTRKSSRRDACR